MNRIAKIDLCSLIVITSLVISVLYFELETKALNAEELPDNTLEVNIENFCTPFKSFTPEKTEPYKVPPYDADTSTIYYPPPLSTPSPTPTILPLDTIKKERNQQYQSSTRSHPKILTQA